MPKFNKGSFVNPGAQGCMWVLYEDQIRYQEAKGDREELEAPAEGIGQVLVCRLQV